jgi:hypothetical protein
MLKLNRSETVIKARALLKETARRLGEGVGSVLSRRRPSTEP